MLDLLRTCKTCSHLEVLEQLRLTTPVGFHQEVPGATALSEAVLRMATLQALTAPGPKLRRVLR